MSNVNAARASSLGSASTSAVCRSARCCRVNTHALLRTRVPANAMNSVHSTAREPPCPPGPVAPHAHLQGSPCCSYSTATTHCHAYSNRGSPSHAVCRSRSTGRRVTLCHGRGDGGSGGSSKSGPPSASAAASAATLHLPYGASSRSSTLCHAHRGGGPSGIGAVALQLPYGMDLASYPSMEGRNVLITGADYK